MHYTCITLCVLQVADPTRVPFVGLAAEKLVQMPVFRHVMVCWTGNIESASQEKIIDPYPL